MDQGENALNRIGFSAPLFRDVSVLNLGNIESSSGSIELFTVSKFYLELVDYKVSYIDELSVPNSLINDLLEKKIEIAEAEEYCRKNIFSKVGDPYGIWSDYLGGNVLVTPEVDPSFSYRGILRKWFEEYGLTMRELPIPCVDLSDVASDGKTSWWKKKIKIDMEEIFECKEIDSAAKISRDYFDNMPYLLDRYLLVGISRSLELVTEKVAHAGLAGYALFLVEGEIESGEKRRKQVGLAYTGTVFIPVGEGDASVFDKNPDIPAEKIYAISTGSPGVDVGPEGERAYLYSNASGGNNYKVGDRYRELYSKEIPLGHEPIDGLDRKKKIVL